MILGLGTQRLHSIRIDFIVCYFNGAIMPQKVSEFNGSTSVFFCVNMYSCHIFW